ncbi:MAG: EAL domain-containing protein [Bryobacteraceae bacterium]|nr:EAL domain-containing protein [Bryobacteraceae bacterium]
MREHAGAAGPPLLVVDDEEPNRDMLSRRLQRVGYAVEVAEGGREALERIREGEIELMLLDIMMPGMSGIELLKIVRATHSPEELPVIMVTAVSERDGVAEALQQGANDYVVKPIDFPVVRARIDSQLRRKKAERELRRSEERYALAAQGANDGLWHWDLQDNRIYYSPRWRELLGYADGEIGDSPEEWLARVHPQDRAAVETQLGAALAESKDGTFVSEHRVQHRNGSFRWVLARAGIQFGHNGTAERMSGSLTDITSNKTLDPLTGLANRLWLVDAMERRLALARTNAAWNFAMIFMDIDQFKIINDSLGHLVGDQLLVGVARRLQHAVRNRETGRGADLVARFGGDEFAILVDGIESAEDAEVVAARLLEGIRKPFDLDGKEVFASISVGIALGSPHYDSPAELLRDADTAMYRAKTLGKDRYAVFDGEMRLRALERLELEQDLRRALDQDQLSIFYQPKVHLPDGALAGFEALARWRHPVRGLVPPAEFIPVAEECGLIIPIGTWVLKQACQTMSRWRSEYSACPPLEISVNVSARQLRQADFVETVRAALEESGLPPSSLQLEVTESVVLVDTEATVAILAQIKALGVGLKIDDFGTGYSSLKYLQNYSFDALKIDRSFVMRIGQDQNSAEVVKAILSLGRSMNLEIVAEGIETAEQREYLNDFGCHFGQGYYIARPMAEKDAETYLADACSRVAPDAC